MTDKEAMAEHIEDRKWYFHQLLKNTQEGLEKFQEEN